MVTKGEYDYYLAGQLWPVGLILYLLRLCFPKKCRYFISCHGLDLESVKTNWLKKIIAKQIIKRAVLITVNSQATGHILKQFTQPDKMITIYPAANKLTEPTASQLDELNQKYNLNNQPILLSVSRLVARKGQDLIINNLNQIWTKIPDLIYVCLGQGPEEQRLRQLASQTNKPKQIIFITSATNEELAAWYQKAKLFCLPVHHCPTDPEGFGMVYLEANSFGLPVIGSQTGGIPEAIKNNESGLIIEPDQPEQLINAINQLLTNQDLWEKLHQQAPIWAKHFDWPISAANFFTAVKQL